MLIRLQPIISVEGRAPRVIDVLAVLDLWNPGSRPLNRRGRPIFRQRPSWLVSKILGYNLYHTKQESRGGCPGFGNPGRRGRRLPQHEVRRFPCEWRILVTNIQILLSLAWSINMEYKRCYQDLDSVTNIWKLSPILNHRQHDVTNITIVVATHDPKYMTHIIWTIWYRRSISKNVIKS